MERKPIPLGLKAGELHQDVPMSRLNSLRKKGKRGQNAWEIGDRKPSPEPHRSILRHSNAIDFLRVPRNSFFSQPVKPCRFKTKSSHNLKCNSPAHAAIQHMERMEIVKLTTVAKHDRVYCSKTLLDILEGPAKLSGSLSERAISISGRSANWNGELGNINAVEVISVRNLEDRGCRVRVPAPHQVS